MTDYAEPWVQKKNEEFWRMETQRVEDEVASLLDRFHKLHLVRTAALLLFWLKAVPLKRFSRICCC